MRVDPLRGQSSELNANEGSYILVFRERDEYAFVLTFLTWGAKVKDSEWIPLSGFRIEVNGRLASLVSDFVRFAGKIVE
jgi:hypothetical protein